MDDHDSRTIGCVKLIKNFFLFRFYYEYNLFFMHFDNDNSINDNIDSDDSNDNNIETNGIIYIY